MGLGRSGFFNNSAFPWNVLAEGEEGIRIWHILELHAGQKTLLDSTFVSCALQDASNTSPEKGPRMDVWYHISHQWLLSSLSTHFLPPFTLLIALCALQEAGVSFGSLLPALPLLTNSPQLCHSEPRSKDRNWIKFPFLLPTSSMSYLACKCIHLQSDDNSI